MPFVLRVALGVAAVLAGTLALLILAAVIRHLLV